ncbi:MAG: hypothetical protein ACRDHF_14125, partial [Tepidiformaceae bacterium]
MRRTRGHAAQRERTATAATPAASTATPATQSRNTILELQRTIGNRAVQRRIEALMARETRGPGGGVDIVDTRVE